MWQCSLLLPRASGSVTLASGALQIGLLLLLLFIITSFEGKETSRSVAVLQSSKAAETQGSN